MELPTQQNGRTVIKGIHFGARGSSCSCDPCDCNPCHCGDQSKPPSWRVSGCVIASGKVGATDLAHLILLSLAQPREERERVEWEEILLVDSRTTPEQITALLTIFEEELASLPAEVGPLPRYERAVYRAPLTYIHDTQRPYLRATLTRDQLTRVRASEKYGQSWPREWSYDGPVALRGEMERQL